MPEQQWRGRSEAHHLSGIAKPNTALSDVNQMYSVRGIFNHPVLGDQKTTAASPQESGRERMGRRRMRAVRKNRERADSSANS
jgi:hypothetical protein